MRRLWIFLIVVIGQGPRLTMADEHALEVKFTDTTTRYVNEGDTVNFTCVVNQDLEYMLDHEVKWNLLQGWSGKDFYLLDKSTLQKDAEPQFYAAKYEIKDGAVHFGLTFKSIRQRDDGKLVCEAKGVKSEVEIVVIKPMTSVSLQLDNLPAINEDDEAAEMINSGQHKVVCKAMDSNPAAKAVDILMAGEKVEVEKYLIKEVHGEELRTYTTTVTGQVNIRYKDHDGKDIQCVATDYQDKIMAVDKLVKIRTPDPNITCDPVETYVGDQMVSVKCIVDHKDISIDGIKYKIVQGNKEYLVCKHTSQKINGNDVSVSETVTGSKTTVILQLQEIQEEYFTGSIHLVVESSGGHLTEGQAVELKAKDPRSGNSDPKSGTSDAKSGTSDPKSGTGDQKSGTSDAKSGTADPKSGTSDLSGSPMMTASLVTVFLASLMSSLIIS